VISQTTCVDLARGSPRGVAPPGLYGSFSLGATGLGSSPGVGNQATGFATNPVIGFGQSLLWVPGWTFFGASYSAGIVQGEYFGLSASSVIRCSQPVRSVAQSSSLRTSRRSACLEADAQLVFCCSIHSRGARRLPMAQQGDRHKHQPRLLDVRTWRGTFVPGCQLAPASQFSL
jgi:hypothetical protein